MVTLSGGATFDDFLNTAVKSEHNVARKLLFTDAWQDVLWLLGQRIQFYSGQLSSLPLDEEHDRERLILLAQLQTLTRFISWVNLQATEESQDDPTPVYVG